MDAFRLRIVRLLPRLRRLALALAQDWADADDLVQAAVERALDREDQWRPDAPLEGWMFRIMKNVWIEETRRRNRRGRVLTAGVDVEAAPDRSLEAMEARVDVSTMQEAMGRLPDEQRIAVALVLVEGLSYREAAELLDVPTATLSTRLFRGRAALARAIDPSEAAA